MNNVKIIEHLDYRLCKTCLQYIKQIEEHCPFCKHEKSDCSFEYESRNLKTIELMWHIEKKIERYELLKFFEIKV